jgi:hypothetical protein
MQGRKTMLLAVDIGLALAASLLLSWIFLRLVHEHGPWRKPWAFGLVTHGFGSDVGLRAASNAS